MFGSWLSSSGFETGRMHIAHCLARVVTVSQLATGERKPSLTREDRVAIYLRNVNPSPPGLLAHPWVPGGGGVSRPPPIVTWKNIVTCSTRRKEHTGRWNFALAPSEAKLSAITGFDHFSALDLTSEVTGWPRTWSLYVNLFVSWRATCSFFPRGSSSIRGETARGSYPLPCAVEGCEMACAGEG